jgi:hypothetical protein
MENVFHCSSLTQKIFCMTSLTGRFDRFIVPILVTEFTGHFLMSIVNLVFGMHIVFEEEVGPPPTHGVMTFLTVCPELRCMRIFMTRIAPSLILLQQLSVHRFHQFPVVASNTLDLHMPAQKSKLGAAIVVKLRLFFCKACNAVTRDAPGPVYHVVLSLVRICVARKAVGEFNSLENSKS